MASNITLSSGVRQNLLSLQSTSTAAAATQNRLATGKKVNTALDNPTNFFTSSALAARASDLSSLLDSMSNGIKTLQAADNGLGSVTKTVESMKATVTQARQDKSWQGASYTIDSGTIGTASTKNLTISGGAVTGTATVALNTAGTGGTKAVLDTSVAYAAPVAAQKATYTAAALYSAGVPAGPEALVINFTPSGGAAKTVNVTLDTTEGTVAEAVDKINAAILLDDDTAGLIKATSAGGKLQIETIDNVDGAITVTGAGETNIFGAQVAVAGSDGAFNFTVNGTNVNLTSGDSPSLATAVNTANVQLQAASSAFEAYDAGGGKFGFREKTAQGATLTLGGSDSGLFTSTTNAGTAGTGGSVKTVDQLVDAINQDSALTGKVKASNDGGKLRIENISTTDLSVVGASSTAVNGGTGGSNTQTIKGNEVRKNLITQFNDLRDQLDKFTNDASFNGVNLLRGDKLRIVLNETNTSSIEIKSSNSNGINVSTLAIGESTGEEFRDDANLDTRLNELNNSLTTLRSQASSFGSNLSIVQNRQDFTKAMINTLQTGADQLVLADSNEEGANLLALQTRQQLSTTALSLSAQADQAVLRLF